MKEGTFEEGDWLWVYRHAIEEYENFIPPIVVDKPHNIKIDRNCENTFKKKTFKIIKPPKLYGRALRCSHCYQNWHTSSYD